MVALCNRADHYIFMLFLLLSSLWSPYVIGQTIYIFMLFLLSSFFISSPNLSGRRLDVCHTSTHGVTLISANLRCRSETCCSRLAGNAGRKNVAKNRHLGTIPQLCRAISSQLRHVSAIGTRRPASADRTARAANFRQDLEAT